MGVPCGKPEITPSRVLGVISRQALLTGLAMTIALAFAVYFLFFSKTEELTVPARKMLVVLPFQNLGSPDEEYFAAGVTEEITGRVASVSGLGVISRTSAVQYAGTDKTIKQIGEELGGGGMGVVYKAEYTKPKYPFVFRMLPCKAVATDADEHVIAK